VSGEALLDARGLASRVALPLLREQLDLPVDGLELVHASGAGRRNGDPLGASPGR
jgi:hypothetical protein